jgi:hypothetical protein
MIYSRKLLIVCGIFILLLAVGGGVGYYLKVTSDSVYDVNKVSSNNTPTPVKNKFIEVDYAEYTDRFSEDEKQQVARDMFIRSTHPSQSKQLDTPPQGKIRPDSYVTATDFEDIFIVDVPSIQTSYSINVYDNSVENVRIINVTCVSDKDKVYPNDYCHEE